MSATPLVRTFTDNHGVETTFFEWSIPKPKAVVQLVHGLGEHARRYDHLVGYLNSKGFSVYANDHRGHGETGAMQVASKATKTLGNLGAGGMDAVFETEHDFTTLVRAENAGLPLILIGQSWGSFIAQKVINKHSSDYDMVVLTGTTLTMPGTMGAFNFNKKWKSPTATGFEWLSRDPEVGKVFLADPKTFYADAAKVMGLINSLKLFGRPAKTVRNDLPILILVGSDDPIGAEKGALALAQSYRKRSGVQDVELIVYEGARHEVFNELNKAEVYSDLLDWIESNLGK